MSRVDAISRNPPYTTDRSHVRTLAEKVQEVTGDSVELAYVDQEYPGAQAAQDAAVHHRPLEVVTLPEAKKGFVLLPTRWVVERSNAWAARFRRLARDYEQGAETLKGLPFVAFAILMLKRVVELIV
jgi:transposase